MSTRVTGMCALPGSRRPAAARVLSGLACIAIGVALCGAAGGDEDLDAAAASADNWALPAGNELNHRFSPLNQINARNVGRLRVAWTFSTGVLRGHEGNPLVVGRTIYIHSPFPNNVVAIDLGTQKIVWRYERNQDPVIPGQMCCDTVSRGLAYGDGKILLQQADSTLVALDARTGQVVWTAVNGDPAVGAVNTNAPHVFKDKVVTGISGGGWGVRGYISAYDLKTGRLAWRGYSTGPDEDMLVDPARTTTWAAGKVRPVGKDSSLQSWIGDQWKLGGGTTWGWYSYDRETNLLYYGTGNPGTFNAVQRPGDNRWATSIWARDLDTGRARWIYQMTPHDQWDYGGTNEAILADITIVRRKVKALVHFDRNGFAYTLDRQTGALLVAQKYAPEVNWARGIDIRSGRPQVAQKFSTERHGTDVVTKGICPAALGTKNQQPAAFNPLNGLFYVPTAHLCMDFEPFHVDYVPGMPYLGAKLSMFPAPGAPMGSFITWDAAAGRIVQSRPEKFPVWSGVLVTAGGIACYGTLDGYLKCVDARDLRRELWKVKTPSGIVGNVFTYMYGGKQYIGVYSGIGGWPTNAIRKGARDGGGSQASGDYAGLSQYYNVGGNLTVFALPPVDRAPGSR
ncbi:MAG TPA: PQQ-dependent dehydrogenase, methanol/ethanol family [Burkholderiales bacterium]|nr:PQQ-dependent dehydrogenase, methanol/ethanol family [Burkholderiales bacterium]